MEATGVGISADDFKSALRRRATGVTVVTARDGQRVHGMTVSAFTEVSLDPPLVLVCAERSAYTLPFITSSGAFAVNVLAADQDALSQRFASKQDEWQRFDGLGYEIGSTGAPLLSNVVANIDCRVVAAHEHGDHVIFVGRVEEVRCFDRAPLLYFGGRYGNFAER